jgi:polysaccharide chain length determinant protein (PEP-CTERM system associated)
MKKSRLTNFHDFLALLVRRRWWVIITAVALCGFSVVFMMIFPKSYISQTMILIQPRDVPSDFVKDLIGSSTDSRLSAIEQTILSRTNLLKILDEFANQLPEYRRINDERKVAKIRKCINIDFPSEKRRGIFLPTTNILITYRDQNPGLAQKIASRLSSLFIEQDNKSRENKVFGTADFLETELNKVTEELKKSEDELRILKQRYRYEMPTELETNLRTLDRLQMQKNSNLEALDRFVTLKMNLERQISETSPTIPAATSGKPEAAGTPGIKIRNSVIENYRKKEQEYNELILKAKPTHPDVRRLKAELEQLRKELSPEELAVLENKDIITGQPVVPVAPAMVPNPVYQSLSAQLRSLVTDIEIREKEKAWIENEMAKYNQRLQNTPGVEQKMQTISRANADLTKRHEDLKRKLDEARLAGSLESRQKGEQFTVIDSANYPMEPAPPGRLMILLAGFAISLAAGVALAIVVDLLNQRILTHHELERALEAPVLVEIPSMITPSDIRRARVKAQMQAVVGVFCAVVYCGGLYFVYLKQAGVLRLLDPLIEKIVAKSAG